jgi:thiol-disulfide isomerase/thioredoxin
MPVFTPQEPALNSPCPDFKLKAVDGKTYQKSDFFRGNPTLVMFICNHCPYVKAIEDRLIQLGHDFKSHNMDIVAICSNDSVNYPEDSFENLTARWKEKNYSFSYLHDETQNVAKIFGAICTPDYFLYDGNDKLKYRGRLDDSWKDAGSVKKRELFEAALAIKNNRPLDFTPTPSMGCSIKWVK